MTHLDQGSPIVQSIIGPYLPYSSTYAFAYAGSRNNGSEVYEFIMRPDDTRQMLTLFFDYYPMRKRTGDITLYIGLGGHTGPLRLIYHNLTRALENLDKHMDMLWDTHSEN